MFLAKKIKKERKNIAHTRPAYIFHLSIHCFRRITLNIHIIFQLPCLDYSFAELKEIKKNNNFPLFPARYFCSLGVIFLLQTYKSRAHYFHKMFNIYRYCLATRKKRNEETARRMRYPISVFLSFGMIFL